MKEKFTHEEKMAIVYALYMLLNMDDNAEFIEQLYLRKVAEDDFTMNADEVKEAIMLKAETAFETLKKMSSEKKSQLMEMLMLMAFTDGDFSNIDFKFIIFIAQQAEIQVSDIQGEKGKHFVESVRKDEAIFKKVFTKG